MGKRRKLPINLPLLERDLRAWAPTYDALAAACAEVGVSISEDTLGRIRSDRSATPQSIEAIAKALNTDPNSYWQRLGSETVDIDLSGEWSALFLDKWEPDYNLGITIENLTIVQRGSHISGIYVFKSHENSDLFRPSIFTLKGRVIKNYVTGIYYVRGRDLSTGIGTFQLKLTNLNEFAEGFCTFCSDKDAVSVSANYWIKKRSYYYEAYMKAAKINLRESGEFFNRPVSK